MMPATPDPAPRRTRCDRSGGSNLRWSTRQTRPTRASKARPGAWLVINPEVREGIRDLQVGLDILVLTWLHQARRDELATQPGDDPTGPERGVFSTRSPARPNPVGLHRATVVAIEDGWLRVQPLEAINETPLVDIKPIITANER